MKTTTDALATLDLSTLSTVTGGAAWNNWTPASGTAGGQVGGQAWGKQAQPTSGAGWTGGTPTGQWSGQ